MFELKVGILGAGAIAGTMAKTLQKMKKAEAYAVASRDLEKAIKFASANGVEKAYGSYEEMLEDKKVGLVYIATPHTMHFEHAKLCIDYGKPVIVEKPFCVNAKQAEELFAYAKAKGVFITEAIWTRYLPMRETIDDLLFGGIIGEPKILTANLGYEITGKERLRSMELAGGALLDVGIYPLHFAMMVFGHDIKEIVSTCTYFETGVDASDSITIHYKDGKMAILSASMVATSDRQGIIQGTDGYMIIENINNYETITVYNNAHKKILVKKRPKQITGFEYEIEACRIALKDKELETDYAPHKETIRALSIMDKLRHKWGIKYPCE